MSSEPFEQDFRRFCSTRDPAALAAVFDATAPRLLLVAMHLVRDAATAEDLVQAVFLQVLRDADRFDRTRPVLPWLLGMLEHRAHDLRRRAHVRRERPGGDLVQTIESAAAGTTPVANAAHTELREKVAEAIAGMPAEYRTVLTLRLVHGLAAVDIAHAHGLPPATVRTRLRRGLELLRGALPRGLATPGLVALLGAELLRARDGLAAVRAKVLLAAGAAAPVGLGSWLGLAVALLLLLGAGLGGASLLAPGEPQQSAIPAAVAVGSSGVVLEANGGQPAADRVPVATGVPSQPAARVGSTVRGRCVDERGQPLAGVEVAWHVMKAYRAPALGEDGDAPFEPPLPARTADDGTFAFAFVPPALREIQLVCTSPHHVTGHADVGELHEGVDCDLGDVQMPAGTRVRLRLLVGSRPLTATRLSFAPVTNGSLPGSQSVHGPSDDHGIVDLGVVEPGLWHHEVETQYCDREGNLQVPLQTIPFEATVVLREPPAAAAIAGVVVDMQGLPVRGLELALPAPGAGSYVTTSETDGHFVWSLPPAFAAPADWRLARVSPALDFEVVDDGGALQPGRSDVRIVVRRRARSSLRLEVVDGEGQPVTRFGARCWPDPWRSGPARRMPVFTRAPVEDHPGGEARLDDLAPGACFVSVFPCAPFAEAAELTTELVEGREASLRVVVRPPVALHVDVVAAADGQPLPGVRVQLAKVVPAGARDEVDLRTWRLDVGLARSGFGWSSSVNVLVLASGTSDRDGVVRLLAPADVPGLVLIAGGERCREHIERNVVLGTDGARVRLPLLAAGTLAGSIEPATFVAHFGPDPQRLAVHAQRAAERRVDDDAFADDYPLVALRSCGRPDERPMVGQHVRPDGTFALGGVAPGSYEVWVSVATMHRHVDLGPLQRVDIGPTTSPNLTLDLSRWSPARCELVLACEGVPRAGRGGLLSLAADGTADATLELDVDAAGRLRSPWLLPGRYVPYLRDDSVPLRGLPIHADSVLVLGAADDLRQTFDLRRRSLALAFVDAAGLPVPQVVVAIEALDRPELPTYPWRRLTSGADGRILVPAVPPGRLRVRCWRPGDEQPDQLLGLVAADASEATLLVR